MNVTESTLFCSSEMVLFEKDAEEFILSAGFAWYFIIPISFVAIVGNGLVIAAVKTNRKLQSNYYYLVAFLATTDFLAGILSMPLQESYIVYLIKEKYVPCYLSLITVVTNSLLAAMSAVTIALMSFDRFLAMRYVMSYRVWTLKSVYKIIYILSWTICALLVVMPFVWVPYSNALRIVGASFIVLVFIFICLLNSIIFISLKLKTNMVSQHVLQNAVIRRRKTLRQSTVTLLLVALLFVVCFLPRAVFLGTSSRSNHEAHLWTLTALYLNSALNPLLYGFRNHAIFNSIVKLFKMVNRRGICAPGNA